MKKLLFILFFVFSHSAFSGEDYWYVKVSGTTFYGKTGNQACTNAGFTSSSNQPAGYINFCIRDGQSGPVLYHPSCPENNPYYVGPPEVCSGEKEEDRCALVAGKTSKGYARDCGSGYAIQECSVDLADGSVATVNPELGTYGDWVFTGAKANCPSDGNGSSGGGSEGGGSEGGGSGSGSSGSGSGSGSGSTGSGSGSGSTGSGSGSTGSGSGEGNGTCDPTVEECGEGEGSASGFSCDQPLSCKGDVIQCAQLEKQKEIKCAQEELYRLDDDIRQQLNNKVSQNTHEIPGFGGVEGDVIDVSKMIDKGSSWLPRSCPAPISVDVGGQNIQFSFNYICDFATWMSGVVVAIFSFLGIRIFARNG